MKRRVFIAGSTGYMGSRLIPKLIERGHDPLALVRESSKLKLPAGVRRVIGDALNAETFQNSVGTCDTFVHLVGVSHPGPGKAQQFVDIDSKSAFASLKAAQSAAVQHFVFVSVAHPAPVMKHYIDVRVRCEKALQDTGLNATILRPWYVLGPGHWWPYALVPFYKIAEHLPQTRESAMRLGLVTIREMIAALVHAIENPPVGRQIFQPVDIRRVGASLSLPESGRVSQTS